MTGTWSQSHVPVVSAQDGRHAHVLLLCFSFSQVLLTLCRPQSQYYTYIPTSGEHILYPNNTCLHVCMLIHGFSARIHIWTLIEAGWHTIDACSSTTLFRLSVFCFLRSHVGSDASCSDKVLLYSTEKSKNTITSSREGSQLKPEPLMARMKRAKNAAGARAIKRDTSQLLALFSWASSWGNDWEKVIQSCYSRLILRLEGNYSRDDEARTRVRNIKPEVFLNTVLQS